MGPPGPSGVQGPIGPTGNTGATGPAGAGAPLAFDQVGAQITANSGGYAADPGSPGPTVTVDVPDAGGGEGFIEVSAQVDSNGDQSAIGLFDVTEGGTTFVSGQDTVCVDTIPTTLPGDLFMTVDGVPGTYGTPIGFAGFICVPAVGPPAAVLLQVPAGTRTFELQYADCGCGGTPMVENRRLWIAPRPAL
jgi:hypothetical protein